MGIPDNSLLHFIKKISSWISWGNSEMSDNNCNMCCLCQAIISDACIKCHCQSCKRLFCKKCLSLDESKLCKLCFNLSKSAIRCRGKIYPSESPRQSPEPPSPSFSGDRSSENPSPVSVRRSPSRSDEDEGDDSNNFFSASSEYYHDTSDLDSVCVSSRHDFCSFTTSVGSSPSDSPSRIHITSNRVGHYYVQQDNEQALLEKPAKDLWDPRKVDEKRPPQPLDLESNSQIWLPPPPDDEENSFFTYDDDEDDEIGAIFSPNVEHKEPLRDIVQGHFRLLVSQLLQGENCDFEEWLNIITTISWQAANFIRPDTSRGGSMDPSDYVKVKCVASGSHTESKVIKGVVCTKNIKHKRMTSQYKNTRLLLLGGALEYQRDPNQLASFNTLLQQENDYLKMIVSKIEAHRPNVLLVEKTVSSFAQDQLLAKEISLVLNVKRPLLEKIAKCTGAVIAPSTDSISTTRLGHCELFHLEKISQDHEPANQFNRKPSKTLMFFEGCPRRLGCTVVLRGSSREELKKVKNVVQYAIFAAYHLSLETSFLADEGASLPIRIGSPVPDLELGLKESLSELAEDSSDEFSIPDEFRFRKSLSEACIENLALDGPIDDIRADNLDNSSEYFSSNENNQSILVSFSSHSVLNGTICERPRLVRVKFYGPSDKPLGRYLRDDLFDKSCRCRSCKESSEGHAICYTHQNGNLTINVRQISSTKLLPGEQDGKIWMWHRCLKCTHIEGVPPATQRVIMSDAAWGLSFGKFLELSFSNHATGNRLASCGHSLQRDCLRFYGFGNMIAFFQYSPINILSVCLPPSILEFSCPGEQSWIRKEALELLCKAKALYAEISAVLEEINQRSLSSMHEFSDASDLHSHVLELYDMLAKEKDYYEDLLQLDDKEIIDILEINRLRHSLIIGSNVWDRRLYLLDSLLRRSSISKAGLSKLKGMPSEDSEKYLEDSEYKLPDYPKLQECPQEEPKIEPNVQNEENFVNDTSLERRPSAGSILSDQIDSAWSGADLAPLEDKKEIPSFRRLLSPTRVYSFDSAQILQERMKKIPPNSTHLSTLRSFHASGDYKYMVKDPVRNFQRTYSQVSPIEAEKLNLTTQRPPQSLISSTSLLPEGARLIVPQNGDIIVTVYDNEPTSIISHALSSNDYFDWVLNKQPNVPERVNSVASDLSTWQSFGSLDLDNFGNYNSEDALAEPKSRSPHLRISFKDDSAPASSGRVKFSVTCYFAKQFDALRKRCCPNEVDFIRSLSRCMKWKAQGGKSNVYFAKSFDERFIIKQVTKTELESFDEFAPEYFKYLTDSLSSGSPTCLAKVLGLYQVSVKHSIGGKETKMELMVMENLFFGRSISKVYDLKGSERSRYNSDKTGANKVLLDMNLLEALRTNPIFLGSKAKRRLERAVWNDSSFLASVDVMDYSLLVGVDEERKELVLGIIDYMRQYTWDKHLETWVKASGILGGPKNASPTIVSPKQYKKRFRKAMTTYFLTVPDQWSSS